MVSRSRTVIALRLSEGSAGASFGKNFSTGSSRLNFPSAIASPTAVALKLLLSDISTCGLSGASGFHHPSAMTWPCRRTMKLCRVLILSAALTKSRTAREDTPCASGELRGSGASAARARVAEKTRNTATRPARIGWKVIGLPAYASPPKTRAERSDAQDDGRSVPARHLPAGGFEEEPRPPLRLVDPVLDEA